MATGHYHAFDFALNYDKMSHIKLVCISEAENVMDFKERVLASWCADVPDEKKQIQIALCEASKVYTEVIFGLVKECPERTLAIRRLQEANFWIKQAFCEK